ncbi:MAG: phytoene desaturase family protein, partial [Candidatus Sericytochromatia bacterium]
NESETNDNKIVFDKNFKDEKLKALVVSQWGDYGLTPEKSSFLIHSVIATHYFNGGYYPVGGAGKIAESIIPVIESNGGKVLSSHGVKEIIIKNDTAIGVKVEHNLGNKIEELEFYASKIVSNTGAYITYKKLLSEKYSINFKDDLQNLSKQGTKHINVFLGLKDTPEKLGFKGENHWVYNSYNHSDSNNFDSYYLSFPSLKNPESKFHTVEIIVLFNDENKFNEWINTKWKKRGFEYESLKQEIANKLIDQVESRYNGFKDLIDYVEVSTPLTTEYFTSHNNGNIYGIPATPEKYKKTWLGINTNVKNLYLTGTDAGSHGFVGAMMTAVLATGVVSGMPLGLFKIFRSILNK